MTSSFEISPYVSILHEELYCAIGGPFHPVHADHYDRYPQSKIHESGRYLELWMSRNLDNRTSSLDNCFELAIQGWVEKKIKELRYCKEVCSRLMKIVVDSPPNLAHSHLNFIADDINNRSQPPIFEEDDEDSDLILVDDGTDRQIAILNEWHQNPNRVLEALPRIKAAFDYLKNKKNY